MRNTIAELAPMMQGTVPYDTFIVSEGASVIAGHAGGTMLPHFPENNLEGVTDAKPEIWSDWQAFAALSDELKADADALAEAAPNGPAPTAPPPGEMAGTDHSDMDMTGTPQPAQGFTVAELMGYAPAAAETAVTRGSSDPTVLELDPATPAADDLFNRISAACSSCHAQFRAGRN